MQKTIEHNSISIPHALYLQSKISAKKLQFYCFQFYFSLFVSFLMLVFLISSCAFHCARTHTNTISIHQETSKKNESVCIKWFNDHRIVLCKRQNILRWTHILLILMCHWNENWARLLTAKKKMKIYMHRSKSRKIYLWIRYILNDLWPICQQKCELMR